MAQGESVRWVKDREIVRERGERQTHRERAREMYACTGTGGKFIYNITNPCLAEGKGGRAMTCC